MKKLIIALAVLAATTTAQAETICETYSGLAETIMDGRQTGTSMATMIAIVSDDAYATHIVRTAYEQPRWHTDESQQRAIEGFRDEVYLECYKAVEK